MRVNRSHLNRLGTRALVFATTALAPVYAFAAGKEEVKGLPQLDFTTYPTQIFWMFIIFGIMYLVFAKKTLPEISSTIEDRREKIQEDLEASEKLREEAEDVHTTYDETLVNAQLESTKRFKSTEDKVKKKAEKKIQAFRDRSSSQIAELEQEIEKAKKAAIADMHSIAAETASLAAEKIVGVSTDIKDAKDVVKNIDRKAA